MKIAHRLDEAVIVPLTALLPAFTDLSTLELTYSAEGGSVIAEGPATFDGTNMVCGPVPYSCTLLTPSVEGVRFPTMDIR